MVCFSCPVGYCSLRGTRGKRKRDVFIMTDNTSRFVNNLENSDHKKR